MELGDPEDSLTETTTKPSNEKKSKSIYSMNKRILFRFLLDLRATSGTLMSRQKVRRKLFR